MIVARGCSVDLGGRRVLDAIDLEASRGSVIAIVGRNAAGKTTLLRTLAGLLPRSGGSIAWDGRPLDALSVAERARHAAFVAQRPFVAARFSVAETVALGCHAQPVGAEERSGRIADALARFALDGLAGRAYHELSVGQQQRVALARAFAQQPAGGCLFLDEPCSAMDLGETARTIRVLRGYATGCEGRAPGLVLAVLHDLGQARACADRIWLLDGGRLVEDGDPATVLDPVRLEARFGVPFDRAPNGTPVPRY
jgi:iron complex transport system ATP-binding protein